MFAALSFIVGMFVGAAVLGGLALAWPEPAVFHDE